MYGPRRSRHSSTIAIHQPAPAIIAPPPASNCQMRRHERGRRGDEVGEPEGGHDQQRLQHLGEEAEARRARRRSSSQRVLAVSSARTMAYAPTTSRSTSSASGLLKRNISTATGVSAITAPASRPAPGRTSGAPSRRARRPRRRRTEPRGTRIDHEFSPKIRTERPISHSEAGVLSTVMELPASEDPKKNAFQLSEPACAAAE